jgi:hypothetical protein
LLAICVHSRWQGDSPSTAYFGSGLNSSRKYFRWTLSWPLSVHWRCNTLGLFYTERLEEPNTSDQWNSLSWTSLAWIWTFARESQLIESSTPPTCLVSWC